MSKITDSLFKREDEINDILENMYEEVCVRGDRTYTLFLDNYTGELVPGSYAGDGFPVTNSDEWTVLLSYHSSANGHVRESKDSWIEEAFHHIYEAIMEVEDDE